MNKTVLMPIRVPDGDYCWDVGRTICDHFDNEGGHGTCDLGMWPQGNKQGGYDKPIDCLRFKEEE